MYIDIGNRGGLNDAYFRLNISINARCETLTASIPDHVAKYSYHTGTPLACSTHSYRTVPYHLYRTLQRSRPFCCRCLLSVPAFCLRVPTRIRSEQKSRAPVEISSEPEQVEQMVAFQTVTADLPLLQWLHGGKVGAGIYIYSYNSTACFFGSSGDSQ